MALDTHNAASFWNKALLDNSARPSGALVYAGPEGAHLTDEQFSRLKEELEENFSVEGGLDWKALSLSPKDMDFTESKAGAAREIALAFGVPPLLLGLPGDNTFSNYAEANRAFWRQTVLPLVARVQKSFQAWLQPGFGSFRLDYNADRLEALASERASEWERVGKAAFLTLDEQREALGYGPAPKEALFAKRDLALERRYSPDQPRVPAGSSGGGQWTSGGGGGDSGGGSSGGRDDRTRRRDVEDRVRTALNANPNVASDADNPITRVQSRRVGGGAGATPAQFARETITAERAARAMTRVQELDPDWRPPQTLIDPENIEHRIERNESDFSEADARYAELLRAKFGDNMPPRDSFRRLRTRESVIEEFYPSGVTGPEQDRIDSLARDPASPRQPRWPEVATILRLEKETGRPFKRSSASGADFQNEFGQTWDAVGSDASDQFFNYEEFTNRLNRKLSNRAVDRYVVDLSGLGGKNAARVLSYIWGLPVETQARIRVLR
ncbi:MAG: Phage portal protein HK97 [Methylocystaceae bacterium]|nr:MAG: Phage portal protein HK97 [Methylocystaceae bacterium]